MNVLNDPIFSVTPLGDHMVPGAWRYMLPSKFLTIHFPKEAAASCASCPMIEQLGYRSDCRCCTYFPQIPNFMLGLASLDSRTSYFVQRLIERKNALPLGGELTPLQQYDNAAIYAAGGFGRSKEITCPFIDLANGGCGMYSYRNSICATYFCVNEGDTQGAGFWSSAQKYIERFESLLSLWVLDQLGVDARDHVEKIDLLSGDLASLSEVKSEAWSGEVRAYLWGDWFGRESLFYEKCAELVMKNRHALCGIAAAQPLLIPREYEIAVESMGFGDIVRDLDAPIPSLEQLWDNVLNNMCLESQRGSDR